jgi:CO/xanthine dehydrogenase Mo-binding subunit
MTLWRASRRAARPAALKAAALSVALCVAGAQVAEPFQISTTMGYDFADFAASTPSGGLIGGAQVRLDRPDAGVMRCPFPHQACFAFESAVDELACNLGMDPDSASAE